MKPLHQIGEGIQIFMSVAAKVIKIEEMNSSLLQCVLQLSSICRDIMASEADVQCPQNIDAGPVFPYSVLFVQFHERVIRVRSFLRRYVCLSDCLDSSMRI